MDQIPINVVIFGSIPEAILVISLGLKLIGERPPAKNIVLASTIQGIAAYYIRRGAGFGVHTLLQYVTMCILVWLIVKTPIKTSLLAVLIGFIISALVEGVMISIVPELVGISLVEMMSRSWVRVGLFLPQLSILAV